MSAMGASLHVLIVGSAPTDPEQLRRLYIDTQYLICADGGGDAALQAGLSPDLLLGDMDSISPGNLERLRGAGVRVVEHRPEKEKTDIELALDTALVLGASRITIAGALGGIRLDHSLGNLLLLSMPELREHRHMHGGWGNRSSRGVGPRRDPGTSRRLCELIPPNRSSAWRADRGPSLSSARRDASSRLHARREQRVGGRRGVNKVGGRLPVGD